MVFLQKCLLIQNLHLKKYLDEGCINKRNRKILLGVKYECITSEKEKSGNDSVHIKPIYLKDEDITPQLAEEIKKQCQSVDVAQKRLDVFHFLERKLLVQLNSTNRFSSIFFVVLRFSTWTNTIPIGPRIQDFGRQIF